MVAGSDRKFSRREILGLAMRRQNGPLVDGDDVVAVSSTPVAGGPSSLRSGNVLARIVDFVCSEIGHTARIVVIPDYRPDVVEKIADLSGVPLFDFRAAVMAPRMWKAHAVTLSELDEELRIASSSAPAIVTNLDALLATKERQERIDWYARFLNSTFRHLVVIIATLFDDEIPQGLAQILRVDRDDLPEHSILHRMLELKSTLPQTRRSSPVMVMK